MMFKIPHKVSAIAAFSLSLGAAVLMTACDVFENDLEPNKPSPDGEVHMLKNTNAYIDVNARVSTDGPISIAITRAPMKGSVTEVSSGILKYSPNSNFTSGEDAFTYSVYNTANQLLLSNSVIVVVESDTTNLPCGLYPVDDYVIVNKDSFDNGNGLYVSVLDNDILCGDSIDFQLEIYQAPMLGTATVVGGQIRYYTTADGPYVDTLIYKVSKISDSTLYGYASMVVDLRQVSCEYTVYNDNFYFDKALHQPDSVALLVLQNDILCDTVLSLEIIDPPHHGIAYPIWNNELGRTFMFSYQWPDSLEVINDSLRYQVCTPQGCKTAMTRINIY